MATLVNASSLLFKLPRKNPVDRSQEAIHVLKHDTTCARKKKNGEPEGSPSGERDRGIRR